MEEIIFDWIYELGNSIISLDSSYNESISGYLRVCSTIRKRKSKFTICKVLWVRKGRVTTWILSASCLVSFTHKHTYSTFKTEINLRQVSMWKGRNFFPPPTIISVQSSFFTCDKFQEKFAMIQLIKIKQSCKLSRSRERYCVVYPVAVLLIDRGFNWPPPSNALLPWPRTERFVVMLYIFCCLLFNFCV